MGQNRLIHCLFSSWRMLHLKIVFMKEFTAIKEITKGKNQLLSKNKDQKTKKSGNMKIFKYNLWNLIRIRKIGLVLWHINHCRLFNAKSSLYIYIKYIWFGLVWFYGISTIVGYLMPNPLYTYILNIYDLVWLGWVLWHINHCRLFNAKSFLYIYSKNPIFNIL